MIGGATTTARELGLWLAQRAEPIVGAAGVSLSSLRSREGIELRLRGALVGACFGASEMRVGANCRFVAPEHMRFGKRVTFYGNTYVNAYGDDGGLEIGDDTHIDVGGVLYAQGRVRIGKRCAIASGVTIYSQSNRDDRPELGDVLAQGVKKAPVVIGDSVWIGARAVILPGVTIADGATIAAGAVVVDDVAPGVTVAGVPARLLKRARAEIA